MGLLSAMDRHGYPVQRPHQAVYRQQGSSKDNRVHYFSPDFVRKGWTSTISMPDRILSFISYIFFTVFTLGHYACSAAGESHKREWSLGKQDIVAIFDNPMRYVPSGCIITVENEIY